jgi:hypothetical protein
MPAGADDLDTLVGPPAMAARQDEGDTQDSEAVTDLRERVLARSRGVAAMALSAALEGRLLVRPRRLDLVGGRRDFLRAPRVERALPELGGAEAHGPVLGSESIARTTPANR